MKPVLLRCLDTGTFVLPDDQILDCAGLAAMQEELSASSLSQNRTTSVANAAEYTLTIPAHRCLLTAVPVARHEASLLRKTLPWMLEERLLEPAESQHFAIGNIKGDTAAVCVISSSWLASVLAELSSAGIHPTMVVPEILLLPWQQGQLSLFPEHDTGAGSHCLIRFGECEGMACSLDNLHFVLQAMLNETAETPEIIALFANAATAAKVREHLPPLLQSIVVLHPPLDWQAIETTNTGLNLLQGGFAPRLPWQHWWRQWRLVAMLFVGLLVTDVVATTLQTAKVRQATAAIDAQIVESFRSVQPEAAIVDPRLQLERAVSALGGRTHEGLAELLERMAPALESSPAIQVQNLDYNSNTGELQMVIVSEGFAAAEALRAGLQSLGLDAELLGSSSEGTRNRSRLRVVI